MEESFMRTSRTLSISAVALALLLAINLNTLAQDQEPSEPPGEVEALPPYAAIEGKLVFLGGPGIGAVISNPDPPKEVWQDWRATGRLVTNDPRLNAEGILNQNYMGFEPGFAGGSVRTGIGRFANDGGSWAVESLGFNQPGVSIVSGTHLALALTGEGGYKGLSAVVFILPAGGEHDWEVRGVIAPAPLPEPPTSVEASAE
jgi:hypothetical protein